MSDTLDATGASPAASGAHPAPYVPGSRRGGFRTWLRRAVLSLILAASAAGMVIAFQESVDEEVASLPSAIVRVFPDDGDLNLRQDRIGYQLEPGFSGILLLDRVEVPEDGLQVVDGINEISVVPGEGGAIGTLAAGRHCATATYWNTERGRAAGSSSFTWCFDVA